jgi:hypothetical protein
MLLMRISQHTIFESRVGLALTSLLLNFFVYLGFHDIYGLVKIAIKKHADLETIYTLLAAFPECVDVRSGSQRLTPYKMAKKSSSPNKRLYQMAFKKGSPTYAAVTGIFGDLLCGVDLNSFMNTVPLLKQQDVSGPTTYISTIQPGTVRKRRLMSTMPLVMEQEVYDPTTHISTVQPGTVRSRQIMRMKSQ